MSERINWTSRLGFILASAGAAVGLGAIWKFPYLAGSNGGSAFLFPYVILSFTIGLVLLLAEIALGGSVKAASSPPTARSAAKSGPFSATSAFSRAFVCCVFIP